MRRLLLAAALASVPLTAPAASAAPPYCVTVSDGGGTIASACAVDGFCMISGGAGSLVWCVFWP